MTNEPIYKTSYEEYVAEYASKRSRHTEHQLRKIDTLEKLAESHPYQFQWRDLGYFRALTRERVARSTSDIMEKMREIETWLDEHAPGWSNHEKDWIAIDDPNVAFHFAVRW